MRRAVEELALSTAVDSGLLEMKQLHKDYDKYRLRIDVRKFVYYKDKDGNSNSLEYRNARDMFFDPEFAKCLFGEGWKEHIAELAKAEHRHTYVKRFLDNEL